MPFIIFQSNIILHILWPNKNHTPALIQYRNKQIGGEVKQKPVLRGKKNPTLNGNRNMYLGETKTYIKGKQKHVFRGNRNLYRGVTVSCFMRVKKLVSRGNRNL